jgi:hypothetical protein
VFFDEPQQVGLRNLTLQAEVIEQRFGAIVLPIMISRPPRIKIKQSMGRMLSSNMLLLNLILLIDVTFSTPIPLNKITE